MEIAAKLKKPLPRPVGWAVRIVIWGIAAVVALVLLRGYGALRLASYLEGCLNQASTPSDSTLLEAQRLGACLEERSGLLGRLLLGGSTRAVKALPNSPPQFIGTWTATRGTLEYRVAMQPDGRFAAEPLRNAPPGATTITGHWGVSGDQMVWLYDEGHFWPPDVNSIKEASDGRFTLVEGSGATTRYTRLSGRAESLGER